MPSSPLPSSLSKQDIAKQYALPERQSKIDLMMRQDGLEEQLYCICRSSDASRFMIGCDRCEEWYHGDCINITEEESRHIRKFFCPKCRRRDPTLTIKYKQKKADATAKPKKDKDKDREDKEKQRQKEKQRHREKEKERSEKERRRQKEERRRQRLENSAKDAAPTDDGKRRDEPPPPTPPAGAVVSDADAESSDAGDVWEPSQRRGGVEKGVAAAPAPAKTGRSAAAKEKSKGKRDRWRTGSSAAAAAAGGDGGDGHRRRKRITSSTDSAGDGAGDADRDAASPPAKASLRAGAANLKVIHCHGPQCVNASRPGSKYCSDQCGLNLATARIYQILPQRLQEWNAKPCLAEERNKKELEGIRREQLEARAALEELDRRHQLLDVQVAQAKSLAVDSRQDEEAEEVGEGEAESMTVHCATCGHGLTVRAAIRHAERCFNKFESQTSFGSIFQTRIEGNNMFCDFYNPHNRTYCKRLRVLCPEHCKDPKVLDGEVCGYPLVRDVFQDTGEFCRTAKKKCWRHNNWEKLRRAEIDMERVRQWLKLDDLFDKERQIRQAMAQRAGLLPLLLHSTFDHQLQAQLQQQQQQQQQQLQGQP